LAHRAFRAGRDFREFPEQGLRDFKVGLELEFKDHRGFRGHRAFRAGRELPELQRTQVQQVHLEFQALQVALGLQEA
jgi:hypothetical protein